MQGKILIVDAIATNRIVLKVKLRKAYYDVVYAATMQDAIKLATTERPDLIITALALPDGGAAELCRTLSANPVTERIPFMAIGCQQTSEGRLSTLAAGVRDILAQPVDEVLLLARVRSLIRAYNVSAEWQMREDTCRALGLSEPENEFEAQNHCVLVSPDSALLQRYAVRLRPVLNAKLSLANPAELMKQVAQENTPDVFVLILPEKDCAAIEDLRLISAIRASARARHTGLIVLQTAANSAVGANALDLGADDLMTDGFDADELALRVKSVARRKRMGERLRASVRNGLQAAVFDPLTGLYNRRYAMPHLQRVAEHARKANRSFAVMAGDLDHFKRINDIYGHASGDAVLAEVAHRLRSALRRTDMVARVGGEEFLVIMPSTDLADARNAALRICGNISGTPFDIPGSQTPISVTISIGIAIGSADVFRDVDDAKNGQALLAEADNALYAAKGRGRNQVKLGRPAA